MNNNNQFVVKAALRVKSVKDRGLSLKYQETSLNAFFDPLRILRKALTTLDILNALTRTPVYFEAMSFVERDVRNEKVASWLITEIGTGLLYLGHIQEAIFLAHYIEALNDIEAVKLVIFSMVSESHTQGVTG
jgi:hypothetical protein